MIMVMITTPEGCIFEAIFHPIYKLWAIVYFGYVHQYVQYINKSSSVGNLYTRMYWRMLESLYCCIAESMT